MLFIDFWTNFPTNMLSCMFGSNIACQFWTFPCILSNLFYAFFFFLKYLSYLWRLAISSACLSLSEARLNNLAGLAIPIHTCTFRNHDFYLRLASSYQRLSYHHEFRSSYRSWLSTSAWYELFAAWSFTKAFISSN